ncbi:hypothetical protein SAMN05444358_10224 [Ruegeria halocynthiae]|uniref:Uncharacterized protein n=1 Tax=Ruegeria halocynthiae TaxID=985054 RepID=A0A1H2XQK3_9RHOB|nr:hypothetical protein [Ruegeria halocynthiae]SDW95070.1 hypothetical protein SAMN05444358_10224 [Ruegeria halocynthiae]
MHRAIKSQGVKAFVRQEGPWLLISFVIADLFYKWGSFALECVGFLLTWYVLSLLSSLISRLLGEQKSALND